MKYLRFVSTVTQSILKSEVGWKLHLVAIVIALSFPNEVSCYFVFGLYFSTLCNFTDFRICGITIMAAN